MTADHLADLDARYDPHARMPWCHASGPGYHTRVPEGARAHQTREAADYALALLRHGATDRVARAHQVLDALLDLQVTDPLADHYGIWGWFLEEPPQQMQPADWNWADFIGVRLAQVLAVHGGQLQPALAARVRAALRHAAMAIFRRNVDAGYTNIAVMGAVTCAAAGELLDLPLLLEYGRARLAAVLTLRERTGGFTEYNSPAYHRVVIEELERAALIVADRECRDLAERLRALTWAALAERFHPGTGQLAGPMSRAYHDWLQPDLVDYLAARTGAAITARTRQAGRPATDLVPPLPCPADVAPRFHALPAAPTQLRTRFNEQTGGVTWLTDDACLGSADEEFAWTQRRPLLGYWRTSEDPAVLLRARMLLDGHDLSAAWCRQAQDGPRVLSAWWLSYDSGDFHPALDKPAGSIFTLNDLRLAICLRGRGVHGADLGGGRFVLAAGGWSAVVHTVAATFLGDEVTWQVDNRDGEARVEAVLHRGEARQVDLHTATLHAGFAIELVPAGSTPAPHELLHARGEVEHHWRWGDLAVRVPALPTPFPRS
ncbi:hypothetical protein ACSNOB_08675 [Micromonospora sp. URMC 106]|uniref:hypothetical protein n=1 Tax=Micromonospora sp. URMC 106 TaxID=3423408 RepID=UPI003F198B0F